MSTVNEQSTATLAVAFLDADGDPAAPQSINYWIHDAFTLQELTGETSVSPAASVTITLTPTDNAILSNYDTEERIVTVIAEYGVADQVADEYRYSVRNLRHVPAEA